MVLASYLPGDVFECDLGPTSISLSSFCSCFARSDSGLIPSLGAPDSTFSPKRPPGAGLT
eukprot:scaffold1611_cov307-Pinguiococcus_pyrenoidosus.AAC.11